MQKRLISSEHCQTMVKIAVCCLKLLRVAKDCLKLLVYRLKVANRGKEEKQMFVPV